MDDRVMLDRRGLMINGAAALSVAPLAAQAVEQVPDGTLLPRQSPFLNVWEGHGEAAYYFYEREIFTIPMDFDHGYTPARDFSLTEKVDPSFCNPMPIQVASIEQAEDVCLEIAKRHFFAKTYYSLMQSSSPIRTCSCMEQYPSLGVLVRHQGQRIAHRTLRGHGNIVVMHPLALRHFDGAFLYDPAGDDFKTIGRWTHAGQIAYMDIYTSAHLDYHDAYVIRTERTMPTSVIRRDGKLFFCRYVNEKSEELGLPDDYFAAIKIDTDTRIMADTDMCMMGD